MTIDFKTPVPATTESYAQAHVEQGSPSRREELIEISMNMMRLRQVGDFARLADYLTEDCELNVPGLPGMSPFSGSAHGRADCVAALRANFTIIEMIDLVPSIFIHDGNCLVVSWAARLRNRGTGPTMEVNGLSRLRFRGNQISLYANYLDTAALAALAGIQAKIL